jgi:SAM-dependent methyltransferase
MDLLGDDQLERSSVVANCRMNRERDLLGTNGYGRELGFEPLDFLKGRASGHLAAWLDLCCGTGKALIQASEAVHAGRLDVEIVGVDLVGMFHRPAPGTACLRLVEASLTSWEPDRAFDLITCVHGLHYVGDKLGLLARACSWLADDGLFVASLDPGNLKLPDGRVAGRSLTSALRRADLGLDGRRRLVTCRGRKTVALPYRYLGADDGAGPNHTHGPACRGLLLRTRLTGSHHPGG